uniref:YTH domain-containing family protein n=1 Tax=Anthurium amnicola TaxID=1678845 RepID=A0A1D1XE93_9ARAE
MASEKEIKKLDEVVEENKISGSIKKLQEQNLASRKDVSFSDSPPLISSSSDAPNVDRTHRDCKLVSPPVSTYGYLYEGCNGICSRLDTQGSVGSQKDVKIPYPVYHPSGKVPSFNNQGRGQLFQGRGIGNFRLNGQTSVDNNREKLVGNRSRGFDFSNELTRGPRANGREGSLSLLSTKSSLDSLTLREKYNLQDFQIKYEAAKFFMIKSYSEDDIHKSIKYNVWSSTFNGNKKLDAAFREKEARTKEATKCPIFLFFSVNSSGQFIGLAEMTGWVDFNKTMDFWQQDKWHGFFPVTWHIIKDIPNGLFRNIILQNNDNRAVTYSRDTQEIGLLQGLKMLYIFKTFQVKTSILDDFGFYEEKEEKERSLRARRSTALEHPGVATLNTNSSMKHRETTTRMQFSSRSNGTLNNGAASLVALTKNLSINAHRYSGTG